MPFSFVDLVVASAKAYNELPPPSTRYCFPSSSYVIGPLFILPMASCHRVAPSLVRNAIALPPTSPLMVRPVSEVNTPAVPEPSPMGWSQTIFPVW